MKDDITSEADKPVIDESVRKVLQSTDEEAIEKSVQEVRETAVAEASKEKKPPIREDQFIQRILAKMPSRVRSTFTEEQLFALKSALGAYRWTDHKLDARGTFGLGKWQMYYVLIAGKDRRTEHRPERPVPRSTKVYVFGILLWLFAICGVAVIYFLKSLIGINLIPGYSFGGLEWIREVLF